MRAYGSKKSNRPYERIHRVKCRRGQACGECATACHVPTKCGRSHEKRVVAKFIVEECKTPEDVVG